MVKAFFVLLIGGSAAVFGHIAELTKSTDFKVPSSVCEPYKMADVDYSISPVYDDENIYFNIILPFGMELPEEFSLKVDEKSSSCEFKVKIVDEELFVDSKGNFLSEFTVCIAAHNTDKGVCFIATVEKLVVAANTNSSRSSQTTSYTFFTVDTDVSPALLSLSDSKHKGYVHFKTLPKYVCGMPPR